MGCSVTDSGSRSNHVHVRLNGNDYTQMEWTDRHYRFLMRGITRHTQLYTEMVVDATVRVFGALGRAGILCI